MSTSTKLNELNIRAYMSMSAAIGIAISIALDSIIHMVTQTSRSRECFIFSSSLVAVDVILVLYTVNSLKGGKCSIMEQWRRMWKKGINVIQSIIILFSACVIATVAYEIWSQLYYSIAIVFMAAIVCYRFQRSLWDQILVDKTCYVCQRSLSGSQRCSLKT